MEIEIPSSKTRKWGGVSLDNYSNILWRTFNIDLDNTKGHITIPRIFVSNTDTTDSGETNLGIITNFSVSDADATSRWWASVRNGRMLHTTGGFNDSDKFEQDTKASTPTDVRDFTIHEDDSRDTGGAYSSNQRILATRDTDIASLNDTGDNAWNANWWVTTKAQTGLTPSVPHPIEYFPLTRISCIGDGSRIHTVDKSQNVSFGRLVLPSYYQVEHVFISAQRVWVLLSGKFGRNGGILEWDGYSETYLHIYDALSAFPLSGVCYGEVPLVINNRGQILEFNGAGFVAMERNGQEIAFHSYTEIGNSFGVSSTQVSIAPRGMTLSDDGLIYILVKEPSINSQRQLGGVWCLNPKNGDFYLKYPLGFGLSGGFGNQIIYAPGAIKSINVGNSGPTTGQFYASAQIESSAVGTVKSNIWFLSRTINATVTRGFFLTSPIPSVDIRDVYDAIWAKFSAFASTSDKIIVKARGLKAMRDSNRQPIQKTITWTGGTTFTVTLGGSDDALAVGDEVEVVGGDGSGILAHITTISGAHAALQTITIDETNTSATGTAYARFDRWKKLGVIDDSSKYAAPLKIGIDSTFIQFKVEIRGAANDYDIKSLIAHVREQTKSKK